VRYIHNMKTNYRNILVPPDRYAKRTLLKTAKMAKVRSGEWTNSP